MKFDAFCYKSSLGYAFYDFWAHDKWCCRVLEGYTISGVITNGGCVMMDIVLDDDRPWIKLMDVRFCPFCGEKLELSRLPWDKASTAITESGSVK